MRARVNKFPDPEASYVDTTWYDETEKSFDLGYQASKGIA